MKFKNLFKKEEDRAVTPVIGTILMVGITVVLAAVSGAYLFDFGTQTEEPVPLIVLAESDVSGNSITIEHRAGDRLVSDDLTIKVTSGDETLRFGHGSVKKTSTLSAGDVFTIDTKHQKIDFHNDNREEWDRADGDRFDLNSGDKIKVVVVDENSGQLLSKVTFTV